MMPVTTLPAEFAERVFCRIKYLARLKTYQESLPQDGRIERHSVNAQNDIRVATYPTVTGEKIVLRMFNSVHVKGLAKLGFPEGARAELEAFLRRPAGSGKTTTIYACLHHIAKAGQRHVHYR